VEKQQFGLTHIVIEQTIYHTRGEHVNHYTINAVGLLFKNKLSPFLPEYENCENRNDPDLVQVFLKKWWVESDL
jgi:hypothetical protein